MLARIRAARVSMMKRKMLDESKPKPKPRLPLIPGLPTQQVVDAAIGSGCLRQMVAVVLKQKRAMKALNKRPKAGEPAVPQGWRAAYIELEQRPALIDHRNDEEKRTDAVCKALPELATQERYEKRAFARYLKSVRQFDELQD
jgi:hypothetical protein